LENRDWERRELWLRKIRVEGDTNTTDGGGEDKERNALQAWGS